VVLVDGSATEYVCREQRIKLATQDNRQPTNEKPEVSVATLRQGI